MSGVGGLVPTPGVMAGSITKTHGWSIVRNASAERASGHTSALTAESVLGLRFLPITVTAVVG